MCQLFLLLSWCPTFSSNFQSRYSSTPWLFPFLESQGHMLSFQCSLYTLRQSFSFIHSLRKLPPYKLEIKQREWLYNIFIVILALQIEVSRGILVNFRFYGNFGHFLSFKVMWSFFLSHGYFGHFQGFIIILVIFLGFMVI